MNFFEHQDRARRNTSLLVVLFVLAVVLIVLAVDFVIVVLAANAGYPAIWRLPDPRFLIENVAVLGWTSLATVLFIVLASLYKIYSLRKGGAAVARRLGGRPVSRLDDAPALRRLRNVVEEMAIASGVPVPRVYILEKEPGINAFAAGFTPGDAVIGVTMGCVDGLNRNELQGVIAHEFSHILNGDMRLNMQLIGVLFGILCIGMTGEGLLRAVFRGGQGRISGSRRGAGSATLLLLMIGLALAAVGYIGVLFARLIKAALSRQREYLADASAVQFTRDREGISGALKKIAGYVHGSSLNARGTEEVSHMLLGAGGRGFSQLLSSHPPILKRIQAIDPRFREEQLAPYAEEATARIGGAAEHGVVSEILSSLTGGPAGSTTRAAGDESLPLTPEGVTDHVGRPTLAHVRYAANLLMAVPSPVRTAAASGFGSGAVIFALLLSEDERIREKQLALIDEALGETHGAPTRRLHAEVRGLAPEFRLPLVDLALPALKECEPPMIRRVHATIGRLIEADQKIAPFEFALAKVARSHLDDALRPYPGGMHGRGPALSDRMEEVCTLLSIAAALGHEDRLSARNAYDSGMHRLLGSQWPEYAPREPWPVAVDQALARLDSVGMSGKRQLIEALVKTISHDGKVSVEEGEILRAICETLHCPLPPLIVGPAGPDVAEAA